MYYKCPYCDNRVKTRRKPCEYCGGESSKFVVVYEEADHKDKSSTDEERKRNKAYNNLRWLSFLFTIVGTFYFTMGIWFNILVVFVSLFWKDVFFKGQGRVSFWISVVRIIITVVIIILGCLVALIYYD